jgi:hypothetical protein
MMLETDRTRPAFSALFSLNMMLTSPAGAVFAAEEARHLLAEAGFKGLSSKAVEHTPYWVLTGVRP